MIRFSRYNVCPLVTLRWFFCVFLSTIPLYAQNTTTPDTTPIKQDTTINSTIPDTLKHKPVSDSAGNEIDTNTILTDTLQKVLKDSPKNTLKSNLDTVIIPKGVYFGIGIGWGIGNFSIVQLWEGALPDSLSRFNLGKNSFEADSMATNPAYIDTAELKYLIKEQPEHYNITFPISLSLSKLTEYKRFELLTSFAFTNKMLKSTITGLIDSLSEPVNLKQRLRTFTFSLFGNYSFLIPMRYFTIDGVDKSYITIGLGVAPQIVQSLSSAAYTGDNLRLQKIKTAAEDAIQDKSSVGGGISARAGITTMRHVNSTSALAFGFFYSISRYDLFYSDGERLMKNWLNPNLKDKDKPLSYLSNRFDLSVTLLRRKTK